MYYVYLRVSCQTHKRWNHYLIVSCLISERCILYLSVSGQTSKRCIWSSHKDCQVHRTEHLHTNRLGAYTQSPAHPTRFCIAHTHTECNSFTCVVISCLLRRYMYIYIDVYIWRIRWPTNQWWLLPCIPATRALRCPLLSHSSLAYFENVFTYYMGVQTNVAPLWSA